jgi:hypothetical protein
MQRFLISEAIPKNKMPELPTALLEVKDAGVLSTAVVIVVFITQTIQRLTGWNPRWVGAAASLFTASLSLIGRHLFWYEAILLVFLRTCQLYCLGVAGVTILAKQPWKPKRPLKHSTDIDSKVESQLSRPFWVRWY